MELAIVSLPRFGAEHLASWRTEVAWAPIVGPTALLAARRLAALADEGYQSVLEEDLAASLGVGVKILTRSLDRCDGKLLFREPERPWVIGVPSGVRLPSPVALARLPYMVRYELEATA